MTWLDVTPAMVAGAIDTHELPPPSTPESASEMAVFHRLRSSALVRAAITESELAMRMGNSFETILVGFMIACLRTGWYMREDAGGLTPSLETLLTDDEMTLLRAEIRSQA